MVEIRRRSAAGKSLSSGANRGDWLYAAAVRFFGSWGAAVEKAGFDYGEQKQGALSADEVLERIRRLAAADGEPLRAGDHSIVAAGARRHFGGWKRAFEAAGCTPPETLTWTKDAVVAAIRDDIANGLPVNSARTMRRNANLYVAGRRRFGTWAAALIAANVGTAKSRPRARTSKPRARR
ncbi:MAG: hypothetical protein WKG01_19500 [Kofleriaceae bacterium]